MKIRVAIAAAALCGLFACTQAGPPPPTSAPPAVEPAATVMELTAGPDEAPLTIARAVIAPSAGMLQAALLGDPDAMREAAVATAGTCHAASTCPVQFGACTSWSSPSLCNQTCGATFCICRPVWECEGEPPEPRGTETYNAFRVCFDANQNPCTEWSSTTSTFCGC